VAFSEVGVDVVGSFPKVAGRLKFLIVAVDYFKWVEAKPMPRLLPRASKLIFLGTHDLSL
jgi:hypothetical protein